MHTVHIHHPQHLPQAQHLRSSAVTAWMSVWAGFVALLMVNVQPQQAVAQSVAPSVTAPSALRASAARMARLGKFGIQAIQQESSHTAAQTTSIVYDFTPLETLLRDSLARFEGGCSIILIQDGKVLLEKNFGKHSVDSVIPIASGSKWLASALFLTFHDENRLSLDDSVSQFLPYYTDEKAPILLKHLLCHTSGLPGEVAAMRNPKLTLKSAAATIGAQKLLYTPGTAFLYGGASMQTLGRVVEIAGGQRSWELLFQERIAAPLGLAHTSFYGLGETDNPLIGGGAQSTAREFAYFLEMIAAGGMFHGKRILSEKAIALMIRNHAGGVPVMTATSGTLSRKQPPEKASYGLGVWRVTNQQTGELNEVNSQGKWGFSPWIDFRRNVIGVLATKSTLKAIMPTYRRLKQLLRDIVPVKTSAPQPAPNNASTTAK